MGVRAIKGNVKVNVSSCGFLGEVASESKRVRAASKGANRNVQTWVFTSAVAIWLRSVSSAVMCSSTKSRRPATWR